MAHTSGATPFGVAELADQLRTLGVRRGGVLLVHTSFRAVRPIDGGSEGLIAALTDALGPDGTLVMPSWSSDDDVVFDPGSSETSDGLGVVPRTFWRLPGVVRSDHPFAFAARGPRAEALVADPLPLPPHRLESPVGRVWESNGQVLLLGVGHDANTTIHLAEILAGVRYRLPKYVTVREGGGVRRLEYGENDHCCRRFTLVDDWVGDAQRVGRVGHGTARLVASRAVVAAVVPRLEADELLFLHHEDAGCEECMEARRTVPA